MDKIFSSMGPGILMATAAVGGSHLVASTQAGALFGWQLFWLLIAVNILKYHFFRFGVCYTAHSQQSLVKGYYGKSKFIFWLFMAINSIAAIINTAAVLLITAVLLQYLIPIQVSLEVLSYCILLSCLLILLIGKYKLLDTVSKLIMFALSISTLIALFFAIANGQAHPTPTDPPSPYSLALFGFMIALMGWMPAPIEISAINSLWVKEKYKDKPNNKKLALFDFNIGYILTAILALVFFALGAILQYGQDKPIEIAGIAFAKQLIDMYTASIGEWSRWLIAGIAFLCMYGTTITVLDGYARTIDEGVKVSTSNSTINLLNIILVCQSLFAIIVLLFFKADIKAMLMFAMTLAFVTTPVFAFMNFYLVKNELFSKEHFSIKALTYLGLIYLSTFAIGFIAWKVNF